LNGQDILAMNLLGTQLVVVQEVNDNLRGLRGVQQFLPASYRVLVSDRAGNEERLAFVYDTDLVPLLEKVGEIAFSPSDARNVKLPGITQKFDGFDRNPFLAAFEAGPPTFLLVSVHLFFGKETSAESPSKKDINRRALETYGVALVRPAPQESQRLHPQHHRPRRLQP